MAGIIKKMDMAEIVVTLVGTHGKLDKPEGEFAIRTLDDSVDFAGELVKKLKQDYPEMGWTFIIAHKSKSSGENLLSV